MGVAIAGLQVGKPWRFLSRFLYALLHFDFFVSTLSRACMVLCHINVICFAAPPLVILGLIYAPLDHSAFWDTTHQHILVALLCVALHAMLLWVALVLDPTSISIHTIRTAAPSILHPTLFVTTLILLRLVPVQLVGSGLMWITLFFGASAVLHTVDPYLKIRVLDKENLRHQARTCSLHEMPYYNPCWRCVCNSTMFCATRSMINHARCSALAKQAHAAACGVYDRFYHPADQLTMGSKPIDNATLGKVVWDAAEGKMCESCRAGNNADDCTTPEICRHLPAKHQCDAIEGFRKVKYESPKIKILMSEPRDPLCMNQWQDRNASTEPGAARMYLGLDKRILDHHDEIQADRSPSMFYLRGGPAALAATMPGEAHFSAHHVCASSGAGCKKSKSDVDDDPEDTEACMSCCCSMSGCKSDYAKLDMDDGADKEGSKEAKKEADKENPTGKYMGMSPDAETRKMGVGTVKGSPDSYNKVTAYTDAMGSVHARHDVFAGVVADGVVQGWASPVGAQTKLVTPLNTKFVDGEGMLPVTYLVQDCQSMASRHTGAVVQALGVDKTLAELKADVPSDFYDAPTHLYNFGPIDAHEFYIPSVVAILALMLFRTVQHTSVLLELACMCHIIGITAEVIWGLMCGSRTKTSLLLSHVLLSSVHSVTSILYLLALYNSYVDLY